MYYHLLSQMFYNDMNVWTSVNKDNHLKNGSMLKIAGHFVSESTVGSDIVAESLVPHYLLSPVIFPLVRNIMNTLFLNSP
jgi:hypothetical protein